MSGHAHSFKFDIGDEVEIMHVGRVIAATHSQSRPDTFLIRYDVENRTIQEWVDGDLLEKAYEDGK